MFNLLQFNNLENLKGSVLKNVNQNLETTADCESFEGLI